MDEKKIIEQYYELRSCRAVAEVNGVSDESVRRILKRNNVDRTGWKVPERIGPPKRNYKICPLAESERAEVIEAYKRLNNQELAAKETHHSARTVNKILKECGLARGIGGNQDRQTKVTDAQLVKDCKSLTINEIASKYGMHRESLPRRFRKLGVYPIGYRAGHSDTSAANEYWKEHPDEKRGCISRRIYGDCWHYVESHKTKCDERHPGFEYMESRSRPKQVRLKCRICGHIVERDPSTFRQKNILCDNCESGYKLSGARTKLLYTFLAVKDAKTPKTCKTCGGVFYSPHSNQLYCSERCKRKAKPKTGSIRKRCRKYGVYYDPAVTRQKVFERDKYICQICGRPTDPSDTSWGHFGANAPTIDHIVALANGGTHTWDNVQCAHAICNSYKRDLWADKFEEVLSCLA